jgi:DNA transposition AAA+ family ATPase
LVDAAFCSQAEYARRHGVSKQAVSKWIARGWVVLVDGKVDIAKSDAALAKFRDKSDGRAERGSQPKKVNRKPVDAPMVDAAAEEPAQALEQAGQLLASLGAEMTTDEARRVKENYLALSGKLDYEQKAGQLIDLDAARGVMFEEFRRVRDAWQNFPAKYAALIAADLGLEADRVTEVLGGYVHKQIAALGEPQGQFGEG